MKDISALLINLTKKYDHVALPASGAFIKKNNKLTFEETEKWNDGKLENLYAKTYNIPLLTAQVEIQTQVTHITQTLQQSKKYLFAGFGYLYINIANELQFSNELSTLNPSPFHFSRQNFLSHKNNNIMNTKRSFKIWVAFIVILAAGCITALSLIFYPTISKYVASPNTLADSIASKDSVASEITPTINPHEIITVPHHSTQSDSSRLFTQRSKRWHVVVASETTKDKAIEKLRDFSVMGYQPDIIEHQGNFRIFVGRYSDFKTAEKERKKILDKIPDAWLFKL